MSRHEFMWVGKLMYVRLELVKFLQGAGLVLGSPVLGTDARHSRPTWPQNYI